MFLSLRRNALLNESFGDKFSDLRELGVDNGYQGSIHMGKGRRRDLSCYCRASQQTPGGGR